MKNQGTFKIRTLFSNKYVSYSLLLLAGIIIGWLFFHDGRKNETIPVQTTDATEATVWTCSMHPHIRMSEPGKCPICAMDLIPLARNGSTSVDPGAVHFTKEAAALANVHTTVVSRQKASKEIRLYGKVQADERLRQTQVSHVSGRIERLLVNFTGEPVRKGQLLAQVYSPELVTAQQELIEASKTKSTQPAIYEAAKERLRQWKITEDQIESMESSGVAQTLVDVVSNTSGVVTSRLVNTGNYVSRGTPLFEIADLSRLWIFFDAYESDLQFIRKGERITFTLEALPGAKFSGTIEFIDPVIDPVTRVAKVRIEAGNQSGKLKPEMFATGIISTSLTDYRDAVIIPKSAVLWTGKRSIVYVKESGTDEPAFRLREIGLGPELGESYVVTDGLAEGEEIVTMGAFSVDAAAQLEGKPSMMNPVVRSSGTGHDHGSIQSTGLDNGTTAGAEVKTAAIASHAEFRVEGLCEMCKERIETAAKSVRGVKSADWDMDTKQLHISFDKTQTKVDDVKKAIADAGHDNDKYRAADEVYNKLASCCLYRQ